jgi:hypothetical protein
MTSDALISRIIYKNDIFFYFYTSLFVIIFVFLIYFYSFKVKKVDNYLVNKGFKEEKKENIFLKKIFSFYILIVCLFYFIFNILSYELNYSIGQVYKNPEELNKFFSEFQLFSSFIIIILTFLLNKFFYSKTKIINQNLIYGICVLFSVYLVNVSFSIYFIVISGILNVIFFKSLYQMAYEQFIATFSNKIGEKLRGYLDGFFVPKTIILTNFLLTFYPVEYSFEYLNFIVLSVCLCCIILIYFFLKRVFYKYHIHTLNSDIIEEKIRSIQVLGEKGNKIALPILISLFNETKDKILKKHIILSFGNISHLNSINYLYNILNTGDEFLQIAAIEAICMFDSFKVDSFLIDFVQGEKNTSSYTRRIVLSSLHKRYKNAVVPFLFKFLSSQDLRVVANTIENFWNIKDKKMIPIIEPFLIHSNNRIKANSVILLYHFKNDLIHFKCKEALNSLKFSKNIIENLSFIFVCGYLRIGEFASDIEIIYQKNKENKENKEMLKDNVSFALTSLNHPLGYNLYEEIFTSSKEQIQKNLRKFKLVPKNLRALTLKKFLESQKISDHYYNILYLCFMESVFDFSFEIEVLKEVQQKF